MLRRNELPRPSRHRSTRPGHRPGGCAINSRSLVQRRHSRGAVTGVQLSEQRAGYVGDGSVDRGEDAVLPDDLRSGGRRFVLADVAGRRLDATIELGRAGRGVQVEVAEADLDAPRRGRACPCYGGAEEADREKREGSKVVCRFACQGVHCSSPSSVYKHLRKPYAPQSGGA